MSSLRGWALVGLASAILIRPCLAGPPFQTDDPEPVEEHHWEFNNAVMASHRLGETDATLPNVDANYGAAKGLQMHVEPQMAYAKSPAGTRYGWGDTEIGAKYRVVDEGDDADDSTPMIALYPLIEMPTGDSRHGLGSGVVRAFLPVWLQKTSGAWTTYGGGGYWINPQRGARNAWYTGVTSLYQCTEALQLGGELYLQTAAVPHGKDAPGFNVGGNYALAEGYNLLFSAGRGLANAAATNQVSGYLALQVLY